MKSLLVFTSGILLSGCVLFASTQSIKHSDVQTVAVRQTAYGWQLIHQRMALAHSAEEATVRPILERSMDKRIEKLCDGDVLFTDRVFERLYVLDHADGGRHHSYNLLARVVCKDAMEQDPKVFLETLKNNTHVFQVIGTAYHIEAPETAVLTAQIKAQLAEPANQVCPGLLSVQSVQYKSTQTTERLFDGVWWPVEKLKVVVTVTCH
ncbi:hypothetical protein ACFODZ_08720 [Marinicella sediminis]|uniref:Lipoprotein n=1 Tax=Marinicella sediminis TaxID=1792834 RepID=A0ABV7JBU3_9GAMM|nr:hypothetical protein [Marinicella sediminis]